MLINTRDFGEVDVPEEELITFPEGLFAFEDRREFALISPLGEEVYPKWLQSAEDVAPCFIVFDPHAIDPDYVVELEPYEEKLLKLDSKSADINNNNMKVLVIATVPNDFKKTTLNMKAPIVVNENDLLAAQIILQDDYEFRFSLYNEFTEQLFEDYEEFDEFDDVDDTEEDDDEAEDEEAGELC
jgi:flagellar assembly factor FliW